MFILGHAELEAPLNSLIYGQGLSAHDMISWMPDAVEVCHQLKLACQTAPGLVLPDPTRHFTLTVDEWGD